MRGLKKIESLLKESEDDINHETKEDTINRLSEKLKEIEDKIYNDDYLNEYEKWNQIIEDLARLNN